MMKSTESRWISLTEELPPYNKPIILLGAEYDTRTAVRRRPQYCEKFIKRDGTSIFDSNGIPKMHHVPVKTEKWTHWLLIPPLPIDSISDCVLPDRY